MRLLLVEDDVMVASGIKLGLTDAGYAVDWVGSGERAEEVLKTEAFDLAIIDIGLPHMDGLELTRRLRRTEMASHAMPVLILTARDALHDRVQGLDLGADDYMIKPFELPELLARLRALLRRSQAATTAVLSFGPIELDYRQPARDGASRRPVHGHRAGPARVDRDGVPPDQRPQARQQGQAAAGAHRLGQGDHAQRGGGLYLPAARQARAARRGIALDPRLRLPAGAGRAERLGLLSVMLRFLGSHARRATRGADALGVTSDLRRRLLVMLITPLILLALLNAWFDYRSADNVAAQQDQRLLALVPLLADSVIGEGAKPGDAPILLLAPAVEEFIRGRDHAYTISDADGNALLGDPWLAASPPTTLEAEFHSEENLGATWRIVRQRQQTVLGEVTVALADGSDPRQQWARSILVKVLLPNLVLVAAAAFAVRWAVERALKPLLDLREAVERRSPRDLTAIDAGASPAEVRPLVNSLNRLFGLVNVQAESQRRFIADAAHQLRTPLAGLQAQVEAWAQAANAASPGDGTVRLRTEQVNKLRGATRRTSQLASQLLALSRADARTMQAQPMQRVDLKDLCEAMLELHLDAATAKKIDLGLDAQPARVMGHEWLLRELLGNLVDNAVKYTPPGGTVTIRCGHREGSAFVEVEDDGPGVAPTERQRVLERFYRVKGTQGEGNGLGLAIAEEIAQAHHGHLEMQSGASGRGLKVSLAFAG